MVRRFLHRMISLARRFVRCLLTVAILSCAPDQTMYSSDLFVGLFGAQFLASSDHPIVFSFVEYNFLFW